LAPAVLQWSLCGAPEQFEDNTEQACYWELQKFLIMALKANPNILECLYSPMVEKVTELGKELLLIREAFLSQMIFQTFNGYAMSQFKKIEQDIRNHGEVRWTHAMHHTHHYFGFAETQWKLFLKESPRRVKPLLYVYRVLLTGIWLMRTGEVKANLVKLNETFRLPYMEDLVARKLSGSEQSKLEDADVAFHEAEYERLRSELQAAHEASQLPEIPSEETRRALNDLHVRLRLK
jgi:predicted nucleotidyltransferase